MQGAGAAAGGVVAAAIVRDLFGGRRLVVMLSRLALVSGVAPVLAPLLGSALLLVMPWRGIFVVLAVYGTVMLVSASIFLPETLPPRAPQRTWGTTVWQRYRSVFSDRVFIGVLIIGGMTFSGLFSYLSSSSFLFQLGVRLRRPAVRAALRGQLARRRRRRAVRLAARRPVRTAVGDGVVDRGAGGRGIRHHRHRPAGLRAVGHDHPAVLLHDRVRLHVPVRAGARARPARQGRGHGAVDRRRDELRRRRHHLAARRLDRPRRRDHADHDGRGHGRLRDHRGALAVADRAPAHGRALAP